MNLHQKLFLRPIMETATLIFNGIFAILFIYRFEGGNVSVLHQGIECTFFKLNPGYFNTAFGVPLSMIYPHQPGVHHIYGTL